jgi:hypothetical protein
MFRGKQGIHMGFTAIMVAGWWYTYPSEKYEFVNGKDDITYILENKSHDPNHQPGGISEYLT